MSSRPVIQTYNAGFSSSPDMVRLHLNEIPYGSPAAAIEAARSELDERSTVYPDSDCTSLRARIAAHLGLESAMVAVGNGVDELVLLSALTFLGPDRTALVTETTFPGYIQAAAVAGASVRSVPLDGHRVSPTAVGAALLDDIDVAYVCNPVNPTGTVLDRTGVERIVSEAEVAGAIVIFDEAYMDFAGPAFEHALDAVRAGRPVIVMRTFSKAWGLAALRVGYAVGPAELIGRLWRTRQSLPFNVNRLAQRAAEAALDDPAFVESVRERTAQGRQRLYRQLEAIGVDYQSSVTNFVMVKIGGDSAATAATLAANHAILVRDLTPFGLPGCLRVTVGQDDQVDRFCAALASIRSAAAATVDATALTPHWMKPVPTLTPLATSALFNGYVGANVTFALRGLGVWTQLLEGPTPVEVLAEQGGARSDRLRALLVTASLLGYVELRDDVAIITTAGRDLARHIGFFTWGVGGYGGAMAQLTALTRGDDVAVESFRDEAMVAAGSAEAGRALMMPVEAEVLDGLDFASVADIGCGDGSRLIRLCNRGDVPRRGLGLEISEPASALAAKRVADMGLADHIEISRSNIFAAVDPPVFPGIELVSSFLMLHDLFAAKPDGAEVVRALRAAFPDARYFLLADTAAQAWQRHEGPAPAFSLEFELMHALMSVPLVPKEVYEQAFLAGGLDIERCEPLGAPSTWLYLLRVREGGHQ